ncbi:hypothetical protein [Agaribacterium haliotis]|uniref:hypothetical protein n=1 Tax=Agaribacterium haliotis TaxID=2013869 RepID=UPI000BB57AA9|nr:hypothetical protein [Agaribacterium haliotis]
MFRCLLFILFCLSSYASAEVSAALTPDRSIPNSNYAFPNDDKLKPKNGDFKILNYVLMSNELGERWSVITLENLSSGNRKLDQDHLMALFANGKRLAPEQFGLEFKGRESQTITVSFGIHKFPILTIYSSNSK